MVNVKDGLARILDLEGCLACCIVDSNSGMILGSAGAGVDIELAAAGNTDVLRAERKTLKLLGLRDGIEDILVTMGKQYHVFRPLTQNDALFVYVVLDRHQGNLALARHRVGEIEKELTIA